MPLTKVCPQCNAVVIAERVFVSVGMFSAKTLKTPRERKQQLEYLK